MLMKVRSGSREKKTDGNEEYRNIYYHMNPDHERKKFNVGKKYAKQ
jgi:hypothetical protein